MFVKEVKIPTAEEIVAEIPFPARLAEIKARRDKLAIDVLTGKSDKFLVVIGPCSAHEAAPVLEYVERLGRLQEKVEGKLVLIPRIYTNKPRTKGVGYKGMFSQPNPEAGEDICRGIRAIRKLHIDAIDASHLSAADEMLYPENFAYLEDVLTYVTVGARSCENQLHRLVASGVGLPVGIKNPMGGSLAVLLNSVYAAQQSQVFKYHDYQVRTDGNPYAHSILRGMVDNNGNDIPNYHYETVMQLAEGYAARHLAHPAVVVDANHSNSGKAFRQQPRIVDEVLENRILDADFRKIVKGVMVESFLEEGSQVHDEIFGKSITDPCLGWTDTERLICRIAEKV